ncbi:glutathione-dependent reductase [Leptolyngbya sp. BL0902]|uniref:glutathione S-transferase family protein n=1 Tax=Leptolyngbya sp. BL0902 TaxID=1115757 RepID=UPI0018E734CF|nr:glutathione S-transferase C-terminal domain-containing protein [Leptolyngbya sp. BL0902]QQE63544.1 glutathione-dependent reductase [Leptolyngbya sp. BL0902]
MTKTASLPPGLLIRTGKWVWTTLWQRMMAQMAPSNEGGDYQRPPSQCRGELSANGPHPPADQRYGLMVGMGCPWAHRTLIARALKGLEDAVAVVVVEPSPDEGCWVFPTPFQNCRTLPELYRQAGIGGRATVPVLWDFDAKAIVNNDSGEIIQILNQSLNEFATNPDLDLYPAALKTEIDTWNERIYASVNNGVYRCGFAQTQAAYDRACGELFDTLDAIEQTLSTQPYLCGEALTLADVRLFPTLFRFDAVYYSLFKCNRRRIQDYPALCRYVQALYQQPGVAATCDLAAVKRDYYGNLFPLNPGGIIPAGPELPYLSLG